MPKVPKIKDFNHFYKRNNNIQKPWRLDYCYGRQHSGNV
jgi:hypothetical protein